MIDEGKFRKPGAAALIGGLLFAALIVFVARGFVSENNNQVYRPPAEDPAIILAATFESVWCGPCQILKPRLASARRKTADLPIRDISFDLSGGIRTDLQALAATEGIGPVFDRYAGATGFTVLVDRKTGAVISILTAGQSAHSMADSLRKAVQAADEIEA